MKNYKLNFKKVNAVPVKFLAIVSLVMMTATASIAQPPPPPPGPPQIFFYPYTENFNNFVSLVPIQFQGIWSGGIGSLMSYQEHGLNGTMDMSINMSPAVNSDSVYAAFGPFNSNSQLSLSYRIVQYSGPIASSAYQLTADDYITINFIAFSNNAITNLAIINSANHNESTAFQQINTSLAAIAGDSGFVSFNFHGAAGSNYWIDVDNIIFSDGSAVTENVEEVNSKNDYTVFIDADKQINIQQKKFNASQGKTIYSIYDLHGRLITTDLLEEKQRINTSNWSMGMYFIKMQNDLGTHTKKIIL